MKTRRTFFALLLCASLGSSTTGCPGLISALPAITGAIVEIGNVVDTVASWIATWFRAHPDEGAERRVQEAIARTRNAMNVVLRLADATKHADDGQVSKAFDDLEAAYRELLELARPFGVRPEGITSGRTSLASDAPVLTVPSTLRRPRP